MQRLSRILLPVLLLLSGFCGISYEILYAKLLGNLLGNQFTISAGVLLTFLLGIGLGTLYAHRFARWLWAVEAGIGLYAALMALAYDGIDRLIYTSIPALGTSIYICAVVSVVLLAAPAFLVGCSVPLFAAYLGKLRSRHVFSITYAIYNLGAALTALTMEFALLRFVGLRVATLWLASLNIVVALGLLLLNRGGALFPEKPRERLRFDGRVLGALALASVASAIFQLLMIKVAECIFGPFNETFALVLSVVLLGLTLGSLAAARLRLTFNGALLVALVGLALVLVMLPVWVTLYAGLYLAAVKAYTTLVLLKFGMTLVIMGLPAVGFGATIPALLRTHRDVARESGQLLFVSSLANVAGFVLMAFVLHSLLDYGPLLVLVAVLTAVAAAVHAGPKRWPTWAAAALALTALGASFGTWEEGLLYYGYRYYHTSEKLERARKTRSTAERFKGHRDLFAIIEISGRPYFFINGYVSIPLSSASEKIVGALSTTFSPRTDEALVLGVGSGATAGTVGLLFDRTDAVEINDTVLANLDLMAEYNFGLKHQPTVRLIHDDGIHFLKTTPKRYSLILNTVTSPLYFSSSKLYTSDFLATVVARLTPDGVYTTWVDRDIGDRGVDIIMQTLDSVFEECWMTYLKSSYYMMVCSNVEIAPRSLETATGNETLRAYLAEHKEVPLDMIPYSVLALDAFRMSGAPAPANTLDRPVLEHEMSRLDGETRLFEFGERLTARLDLPRVASALEPWTEWDPGAFALWADLRVADESILGTVLDEAVPRQFGDVLDRYEQAAFAAAGRIGTGRGYEVFGRRLYDRERYGASMRAFARATEMDSTLYRSHYYLGRCYERQGADERALEQYELALRQRPDYEKAVEARLHLQDRLSAREDRGGGGNGSDAAP